MESALLIDIGSTFTKVSLFNLDDLSIMGKSQAYTTVDTDVSLGVEKALKGLPEWDKADYRLACSSAAGGLKIVALGLVPELTAEAARRAALGAGSKVLSTYSYELTKGQLDEIIDNNPDIILLAGGTDGGNKEIILHNAHMLAESDLDCPILIAGNRVVADKVNSILDKGGKETYKTDNVMPQLEELNIEPARNMIRKIFLEKIIQAKGLDKVNKIIEGVIMPTPAAVLNAAELLADGSGSESGWGELIVVDIGGATTDVHSLASGKPTGGNVNWRGLEEPYRKRTVEGDLGMRYSAPSLIEAIGSSRLGQLDVIHDNNLCNQDFENYVDSLRQKVDYLPENTKEQIMDRVLAREATRLAAARHVGILKTIYTPMGASSVQEGKDLTEIKTVIGTGGIIVNNQCPHYILEGLLYENQDRPELLAPQDPDFYVDENYIMAAIGLLAEQVPVKALQLLKKYLKKI